MKIFNSQNSLYYGIIIFSFLYVVMPFGNRYNSIVLSLFFCIGIVSSYGVFKARDKKISLNTIIYYFFYFFYFIAPVVQYKTNSVFFTEKIITDNMYIKSISTVFVSLVIYMFLYYFFNKKVTLSLYRLPLEQKRHFNFINYCFISIVSIFFYLYLIKWDFSLLIYRPFLFKLKENTNLGYIGYGLLLVVKQIPFISFLHYSLSSKHTSKLAQLVLVLFVVFISFPTSLSRGIMAVVYIPVTLIFFPKINYKVNFNYLFLVGLLVLFPLFNNFRHWKEGDFTFNFESFNSGQFDAFQNLTFLLNEKLITNGVQLRNNLFFFLSKINGIPNHGSGHIVGVLQDYGYLNVAMPYIGEGYINFGFLGIFIFIAGLAILNVCFNKIIKIENVRVEFKIFFMILIGYEFYLMRGDLMSSIKIISSFILSLLVFNIYHTIVKRIIDDA